MCLISTLFHCFLLHDPFDSTPCVFSTFICGFTDLSSSLLYPFNYFFLVLLAMKSIPFFLFSSSSLLDRFFALTSEQYVLSKEPLFTVFTFTALLISDRHAFAFLSCNVLFHLRSPKSPFMRQMYAVE